MRRAVPVKRLSPPFRYVREGIRLNGFFRRASAGRSLRMRKHLAQISDHRHHSSRRFSAAYEKQNREARCACPFDVYGEVANVKNFA